MIPCSCEFCYQLRLSINGLIFERDPIQRWVKLSAKFGDLLPDVLGMSPSADGLGNGSAPNC
jgi:hypothetical protein